jgi:hypothetical protein
MTGPGSTNAATAATGRSPSLSIVPLSEITGAWPDCLLCTWVGVGSGVMRLKYINAACPVHRGVQTI